MTYLVKKLAVCTAALLLTLTTSYGQFLTGSDSTNRVITTAVPFVSFAPDSRGAGMGDLGVATSPDANSVHWNNGKLAFIDEDYGFSLSYVPWLGNIVDDMAVMYVSGFYQIDRIQTIGASFRYFDLGEIQLTNELGDPLGIENPQELAFDGTYSRKLSENLGIGLTGRFIWSNLAGNLNGDAKSGTSVAVDIGVYYTKDLVFSGKNSNISAGLHLSNIGQKVTYTNQENEDFIPGNIRLGTAFKTNLDPFNSLTLGLDFNKLLVPSPPINRNGQLVGKDPDRSLLAGTFGSFGDAPDGFSEELQEITISVGAEYWYRDIFAGRVGYFYEHENKGGRKFLTLGLGFRYQIFGVDFSYLVPPERNDPLGDTLRVTLLFNLAKKDQSIPGN